MNARPILMGELGVLSLFDLAQLLMLNGATGTLYAASQGRKGFLRFEDGRIVDAVDEWMQEGVTAAYRILAWRTGGFEFRVEPPNDRHTIEDGTESILLEAARQMDEACASGEEDRTRARLEMLARPSGPRPVRERRGRGRREAA